MAKHKKPEDFRSQKDFEKYLLGKKGKKKLPGVAKKLMSSVAVMAATVGTLPLVVEYFPTQHNKESMQENFDYMISAHEDRCPSFYTKTMTALHSTRLRDIANATYADQYADWAKIKDRYKSGMERIDTLFSGEDEHTDALKESEALVHDLARIGVGICFDEALEVKDIGSAYVPDKGLIILNPNLISEVLAIHLRRHTENLRSELVAPYNDIIHEARNSARFERFENMKAFADNVVDGKTLTLPKGGDPNIEEFTQVEAETYKPQLQSARPATTTPKAESPS